MPASARDDGQFHALPGSYLRSMRQAVPEYDEVQRWIVESVTVERQRPLVLDLGIGSGETAARWLAEHPDSRLVGIDASEAMLRIARERLPASSRLLLRDLAAPLPEGPFDAVISAFAVHHLDAAGKQGLFARVHRSLRPGGWLAFGDVVTSGDRSFPPTPIEPGVDLPDTVEDQRRWLRDAGFAAKVVWSERDLAVFSARKMRR